MLEVTQPTTPQPRYPPPPPRKTRRKGGFFDGIFTGIFIGLIVCVLLAVVLALAAYLYFQAYGLILPGVHVGNVELGGLSVNEAALDLNDAWNIGRGFILTDGDRWWYARPTDFGLSLDAVATAQQAYDVGHGQGFLTEMWAMLASLFGGTAVPPVVTVNGETARAQLTAWEEAVNVAPQDASIRIENGQVIAVPGTPGVSLDVESTLTLLVADPGVALADGALHLVMVQVPPSIQDVSGAIAEAERLLANDLTIDGYDPITDTHTQWAAPREAIASWLAVVEGDSGPTVAIDTERMRSYLDELSLSLGAGRIFNAEESAAPIEAALRGETSTAVLIVRHSPTAYTVQPGDTLTSIAWEVGMPYWRIMEANPRMDSGPLSVGQVLTIPSVDDLLPLSVVPNKRIVISIGEQRLWAYENGQVIHEYVISTGIDRSPTQPGVFQVQTHELSAYASLWDLTMPHFMGIYESWPGFMNGLHGLPTLSGGRILWADVLGRPASYGCIILDLDAAETLYNWAEDGVVVEIVE
jgi:LysM repeat protein